MTEVLIVLGFFFVPLIAVVLVQMFLNASRKNRTRD